MIAIIIIHVNNVFRSLLLVIGILFIYLFVIKKKIIFMFVCALLKSTMMILNFVTISMRMSKKIKEEIRKKLFIVDWYESGIEIYSKEMHVDGIDGWQPRE